jgi:threonine dehydratase
MFDLADLDWATEVVRRHVPPTPQYEWALLHHEVGSRVIVKHENHTPLGAFKIRGGLVHLERLLRPRPDVAGIISATRGNHGQSLAYAGRAHGIPVTIVVPRGNSVEKNASMRALGADVIEFGDDYQTAREHSTALAADRNLEAVPPFHPDLVLGVATYAKELFDAVAASGVSLDTVYVPVGMGSGINALIGVRDLLELPTRIVGVVSELAPATKLSFEAGDVVATESASTFVDGVACRSPDPQAISGIVDGAARIIAVADSAVAEAMRIIFRTTHNVAESAGAIALAGLISESPDRRGARSCFILCGGNVDTDQFRSVLAGATPTVV